MNEDFYHGTEIKTSTDAPVVNEIVDMTPTGVIVISSDADDALFPLNTAVEVPDFSDATLAKCGTDGTQKSVLTTLRSQEFEPKTILVRVEEGTDQAETNANVLTGLEILKASANRFGYEIKLLIAPNLETTEVREALQTTAKELNAFAYIALHDETGEEAITTADSFDNRFFMPLYPPAVKHNGEGVYVAALAAATRVMIDKSEEDNDSGIEKTISNVVLKGGIDDIGQDIDYKSKESLANRLNKARITTMIRKGDTFRFWGNRTGSKDEMWAFETDVRIDLLIQEMIEKIVDEEIDDTANNDQLQDVEQLIQVNVLNRLKTDGIIIDGKCYLNLSKNTTDNLMQGITYYGYDFGTFKPFEQPKFSGVITNKYLVNVLNSISQA